MKRASRKPSPVRNPHLAVAYLRVSTEEQHLGPEAQRALILAWAEREGVAIASWHHDQGVSGGAEVVDRPALQSALAEMAATDAGVLVVAKRDRLARDVLIAGWIDRTMERVGARVVAADGAGNDATPQGVFLRTMLDAAAEMERGLIASRTKAALTVKRARGERTGTTPRGMRVGADGATLEEDPQEQETLLRVNELRAQGVPLRGIARTLATEGRVTRRGRPYSAQGVLEMLRVNPKGTP